ncbi:hypothetical protein PAT3040_06081 [Paenibacillus agaridevorans]|uniref:Fe3+-hydroxamate ABC transporter substrate-binding protein n=2 Tax=Paenibacillus agaridevorans TaxID=171404 RepID=A0A2R5F414_9BACL|nr:hypothetical protein PAT3040_06081 [Paenibacillus agaridevorans]
MVMEGNRGISLEEHLKLWNHSAIRVLDIRRSRIGPEEKRASFRMPASGFLLIHQGCADIYIDERRHSVRGAYACHAGKGSLLDIVQVREAVQYDLIFYKAAPAPPHRKELAAVLKKNSPFQSSYGFVPGYPLALYAKSEQMLGLWQAPSALDRFHVRALFHQLVYEMLRQVHEQGGTDVYRPDLVARAVRYLKDHYAEPLGLQELATVLEAGPRQLQRQFKKRHRVGPMEYLIGIRMDQAQAMLMGTQATLREIAEATGYSDSYYFSRAFKKHYGISPLQCRRSCRISASGLSPNPIGEAAKLPYSDVDSANHYQYPSGGEWQVIKRTKSMLAVSLILSLALILGACSGGNGGARSNTNEGASPTSTASSTAAPGPAQAEQAGYPVTIKHLKDDIVLEQKPERIAVLDTKFVDQLIALQEQPAGSVTAAGSSEDFPEYLADQLADVKVLGTRDEPNLEAIVAMDPDLIIITGFQEKIYDSVSKIAPTIVLDFDEDWKDTLVTFGKIVGKEQAAADVLKAYQEKVSSLKEKLQDKMNGESIALLRPRDGGIRVHTPDHRTGAILYRDLGLIAPKAVTEVDDTAYQIALEALPGVGADHYFLLTDDMFKEEAEEYQKTETWQSLEPVKHNRIYNVDTTLWIAYYGPIAINMIVDQVGETLLGDH